MEDYHLDCFGGHGSTIEDLKLDQFVEETQTTISTKTARYAILGGMGNTEVLSEYQENVDCYNELKIMGPAGQEMIANTVASQYISRYSSQPIPIQVFSELASVSKPAIEYMKERFGESIQRQFEVIEQNKHNPNMQVVALNAIYKEQMAKDLLIAVDELGTVLTSCTKYVSEIIVKTLNRYGEIVMELCDDSSIISSARAVEIPDKIVPSPEQEKKYKSKLTAVKKAKKVDKEKIVEEFVKEVVAEQAPADKKEGSQQPKITEQMTRDSINALKASGEIFSNIAILHGRPDEARIIGVLTSAGTQGASIAAGFYGYGALAGTNPYILGAMAVATTMSLVTSLMQGSRSNSQEAMHRFMQHMMASMRDLRTEMRMNFQKLFSRLDAFEQRVFREFLAIELVNQQVLENLRDLSADIGKLERTVTDGITTLSKEIQGVREDLISVETHKTLESISKFISEVIHNEDHGLYSTYRNRLLGYLHQPFTVSNKFLIGDDKGISKTSVEGFSLRSILSECKVKIVDFDKLKAKCSLPSEVYVSPLMCLSQMFIGPNLPDSRFLTEHDQAVYTFSVDGTFILLCKKSKTDWECNIFGDGRLAVHTFAVLTGLFEKMSISPPIKIRPEASLGSYFGIKTLDESLMTSDVYVSHPLVNHTLVKTLAYHMSKEYCPKNADDADLTRINIQEINHMINVGLAIEKNQMLLSQLAKVRPKNPDHRGLTQVLDRVYQKLLKDEIAKIYHEYYNGTYKSMVTLRQSVVIDPSVSCPVWRTWHEAEHNDRNGWSHRSGNGAGGPTVEAHIESYKKQVRDYWSSTFSKFEKETLARHEADKYKVISSLVDVPCNWRSYASPDTGSQLSTTLVVAGACGDNVHAILESRHKSYLKAEYYGLCSVTMKHVITNTDITINVYVDLKHNASKDSKREFKILEFSIPWSKEFNGVTLNPSDGVYSYMYGGEVGGATVDVHIDSWRSHIAGNYSDKYARLPSVVKRDPVIEQADCFKTPTKCINSYTPSDFKVNLEQKLEEIRGACIKKTLDDAEVIRVLEAYSLDIKRCTIWNYWTFKIDQQPAPTIDSARGLTDAEALKKHFQWTLKAPGPDDFFVPNAFNTMSSRAIHASVESFLPYLIEGLSTPEILKEMKVEVEQCMKYHRQLLDDVKMFKSSGDPAKIDDVISKMEHAEKSMFKKTEHLMIKS